MTRQRTHILSDLDRVQRTATCAACGPTKISIRSTGVARCGTGKRLDKVAAKIRSYGITVEQWHAMLVGQSGRCAICLEPMVRPCVDHEHATGRVRALLCGDCNLMIGLSGERPDVLRRGAHYLEQHN